MKRTLCLGLTALVSVSMLAARGSDDDDSVADVQDANAEFCQDLTRLRRVVYGVRGPRSGVGHEGRLRDCRR